MKYKDFDTCQIITVASDYDSFELHSENIAQMSDEDKISLISSILCSVADNQKVARILNTHGFFTQDQIKEGKGICISNIDDLSVWKDSLGNILNWNDRIL